ncbi:MAG TPA: adenylate/guanylate cyclase domain-containing protein [Candidatus Binatia bacterium]|nr:adenylate/guanylate cyclase domain-containing protein [Candidatus Binatia bacterium]
MRDTSPPPPVPLGSLSFDGPLGRQIVELHTWVVREGIRGTAASELFDGICRRLVSAGVPLWRAFVGMPTLHPQWGGYSYTWRRDLNAIEPAQFGRGNEYEMILLRSPFGKLIRQVEKSGPEENPWRYLRWRLAGPEARLDYPILKDLAAAGASDYFAQVVGFGPGGDPSYGTGIGYSFATDLAGGFRDDDLVLLRAVLPALSLAMMTHGGHMIASGLLKAYLGGDAGKRVHAGAVERGSVESVRAVLWYADIRGFTAIADTTPGLNVIELINAIFETLTASLRPRGGQVLKFLGDGMLATFPFVEATRDETCSRALDAAVEAMDGLDRLNAMRRASGKPIASVDLALHLGEVLYGNVGAVDRLDFTVIGPAVNEVARIETLCEPLKCKVLISAELAAAVVDRRRLKPLGYHKLRGVREPREIYGLDLGFKA